MRLLYTSYIPVLYSYFSAELTSLLGSD